MSMERKEFPHLLTKAPPPRSKALHTAATGPSTNKPPATHRPQVLMNGVPNDWPKLKPLDVLGELL